MSNSQPSSAGSGQTQQQNQTLLKADDILRLTCLTDDEKQKYRLLMQNTWNMVNSAAAGSPEQAQARQTLQQFSQKFIARERAHRAKLKQQGGQGQGQGQPGQSNASAQQNAIKQEGQGSAGEAATNPDVPSHINKELVFHHRPTRTLIQADLMFNLPATEQFSKTGIDANSGILTKIFTALQGTKGDAKWQQRTIWYGTSAKDRTGFAASMERINKWGFNRIIPCHGDVMEGDGKGIFEKVMKWHLEGKKST